MSSEFDSQLYIKHHLNFLQVDLRDGSVVGAELSDCSVVGAELSDGSHAQCYVTDLLTFNACSAVSTRWCAGRANQTK